MSYSVIVACLLLFPSAVAKGHGHGAFGVRAPLPARDRGPFMTVRTTAASLAPPRLEASFLLLFCSRRHRPARPPVIAIPPSLSCRATKHDTDRVIARPSSLVALAHRGDGNAPLLRWPFVRAGSPGLQGGDRPPR